MRIEKASDPVYAPNSYGGPAAQTDPYEAGIWQADGELVRAAYTLRADDDDWSQAGALVRDVMDEAARGRLVENVVGHLCDGVSEKVLLRAFEYWRTIDAETGKRVEEGVRAKLGGKSTAPGMGSAVSIQGEQASGLGKADMHLTHLRTE
ncbi:catalase-related domain-containing protein [Novosphingobium sp. 9]|uniref:catalase-related domain-containing protein n=1 Tax=Novosphingobium sp. 9 TaxID=2025349 RepID=UPI0028CB78CF|nr:catalase-related domain-containing protein [Novosphingobium sp. 9]